MKILIISELIPSPAGGGASRQYNLIKSLSKYHEIHLITRAYINDNQFLGELEKYIADITVIEVPQPILPEHSRLYWFVNAWLHTLFDSRPSRCQEIINPKFALAIKRKVLKTKFDVIQIHQAYMADGIGKIDAMMVLDMHDVLSHYEYRVFRSKRKGTHKLHAWFEWQKMRNYERKILGKFDVILNVSEHDRNLVKKIYGFTNTWVVPNGVDIDYFLPQPVDPNIEKENIIFAGSMDYFPNQEGILWFYQQVFPLVKRQCKNVHLFIVGRYPTDNVRNLGRDPSVTVTGFVDDIRSYSKQSAVFIVPLRFGSGTRLKILDAWSMSKAIVSTSIGAEGLLYHPNEDIIISDTPEEFADNIAYLLANPETRRKLGESGRRMVQNNYSWKKIGELLNSIYLGNFQ